MTTLSKKQISQIKALKIQSYIHEKIQEKDYKPNRQHFNKCLNGAKNGRYTYKFTPEEEGQIQEVLKEIVEKLSI